MSDRIDQRIVEMSFENHKFEKGIQQSKGSLQDFSKALTTAVSNSAEFKGMERSLEMISQSFSTMGQIGVGALRRIGEAALNAGMNVFKGLAIAPINQGFSEMELKMNSTQTIMASTGEALGVVNQQLQALNEYSDKTIYSFSDMTANIGKFTNAGVKLDMAVASIKGISNAAALSGANANEASRAMYNFAQALSSGSVKLMDWKSIELANMGTVEFKQQLLDAGVAAGTLAKQSDGMYKVLSKDASGKTMQGVISATKNFNDSLANQWMTTEVLTGTLSKYADETSEIGKRATLAATQVTTLSKLMDTLKESVGSGWAQSFELIFGDFDEARDLWTGMNRTLGTTIGELSDARNALLSGGLGSGWKQFMKEGISDTALFGATLADVAKESGIDIEAMIKKTGSMEKAVQEMVRVNVDGAKNLKEERELILKGQEKWLTGDMLIQTVNKMSSSISKMSDEELRNAGYTERTRAELLALRDALISGKISADDFAKKMSAMSGRENIIQGLKNSVIALLKAIRPISKAFDQIFPPTTVKSLYHMTETFKDFTRRLILTEETTSKIQRTFAGFFAVIDIGWQTVKFLGSALFEIVGLFSPFSGGLLESTASMGDFLVILDQIIKQSGIFEYGLLGIKMAAIIVRDVIATMTHQFMDFFSILMTTDKPLEYLGATIKNIFAGIFDSLQTGLGWMTTKFFGALNSIQKFFSEKLNLGDGSALTIILDSVKDFLLFVVDGGADGIANLGSALNTLDFSRIATFVTGGILLVFVNQLTRLTKVTGDLIETTNGFASKLTKKLFGPITKFKDLALAVAVLSTSLYVLSTVPWDRLKNGLAGLAGAMVIFTASYAAMQAITVMGSKKLAGAEPMAAALNLTAMAGGLAILAIAVMKVSQIDKAKVWNSVAVVGAMMGVVVAYQALSVYISLIPGTRAANIGMSMMASGLLGLITIVMLLDHIQPAVITQSLQKLAGAMLMLAGIQALFSFAARASGGSKVAINVLGISVGILALIGVVKIIGMLSQEDITAGAKNVFLLGGILGGLQIMFSLAARISGGTKLKTHVLAMQMGMVSMIALIAIMGTMDPQDIQNGIVSLAKMALIIGAIEILTGVAARIGGGNKLQKVLGSISLTMIAFTGIIGVIGHFKQTTIDKGFKTIQKMTGLIMGIEVMSAVIGSIRGASRGIGLLLGMTTTILTLTASLALLSMIDQEALAQAASAISKSVISIGIMGVGFGVMIKAFAGMAPGLGLLKSLVVNLVPGFLALGLIFVATLTFFGVIKEASKSLTDISWDSINKFTAGLAIVMALSTALATLTKVPGLGNNWDGLFALIPGFVAMAAVVVGASLMFKEIGKALPSINILTWSSLEKFMAGVAFIGALAVGFALVSKPLAALAALMPEALIGGLVAIVGVTELIGGFVILATVMETLFSGNGGFLIAGIDKMVLVAEGMGRFVGAIIGGFSSEIITDFGKGIAAFAEAVSGIDGSNFSGVESLANAIKTLTAAAIFEGLARMVNNGASSGEIFGKQIVSLVKAFDKISVTSAENMTRVLTVLGPTMESLGVIVGIANTIPNSGGSLGTFVGNNDIDDFGKKIRGLIAALDGIPIMDVMSTGMVLDALAPAMKSLGVIAEVAGTIPNSGGSLATFVGGNNLDSFGKKIKKFITAFETIFVEDADHTTAVLAALAPSMTNLGTFAETAGKIPNSGWALEFFAGGNDIDNFGTKLKGFVTAFGTIDSGQLRAANGNMTLMTMTLLPGLQKFVTLHERLSVANLVQSFKKNTSFTALAEEIKSFVKVLKGVDVSVVAPALASLNSINEAFKRVGNDVIEGAITSLQNNKSLFQTEITNLLNGAVKIVDDHKNDFSDSFTAMFDQTLTDSRKYVGQFQNLGYEIVRGLQKGIGMGQALADNASDKMAASVITSARTRLKVESPSKVFTEIGEWLPIGLAHGIEKNSKVSYLAGATMGDGVEEAVRNSLEVPSESPKFTEIGKWIPKSLSTGMNKTKKSLLDQAKNLGLDTSNLSLKGIADGMVGTEGAVTKSVDTLLDMMYGKTSMVEAAKALGVDTGKAVTTGATTGVNSGKGGVNSAVSGVAKDAFQIFKEAIDKRKEYNLITTTEEIAAWQAFAQKYKVGSEIRMKADKELASVRFEASRTWIDNEKYYKRLSLAEELAAWTRVQNKYQEGHEYRMQAERELFRLKEEIRQADRQHELDKISEEKYYGRLSLTEELTALKKISKMTDTTVDERKEMAREIFRVEKEINAANLDYETKLKKIGTDRAAQRKQAADEYYQQEKTINENLIRDTKVLRDEYKNAIEARSQTLYSSYGLFDKVADEDPVNGLDLVNNLEGQTKAFDTWQNNMSILASKGIDEGLLKELRDMGPKATTQIIALNRLTTPELNKYVALWQKKSQEAKEQAESELQELIRINEAKITELTKEADTKLVGYKTAWTDTLIDIDKETKVQLATLTQEWTASVGGMTTAGINLITKFKTDWAAEMKAIVTDSTTKLTDLKTLLNTAKKTAGIITDTVNASLNDKADTTTPGKNTGVGYAAGIKETTSLVATAATNLGRSALDSLNGFMEIASPSRKTMETGRYVSLGLAEGIRKFANVAALEARGAGVKALDAMTNSMNTIPELLGDDMGDIKITPVVDLSQIQSGVRDMNNMLSNASGLDLSATMGLLPTSTRTSAALAREAQMTATANQPAVAQTTIENNFTLTGVTIREEADITLVARKLYQLQVSKARG